MDRNDFIKTKAYEEHTVEQPTQTEGGISQKIDNFSFDIKQEPELEIIDTNNNLEVFSSKMEPQPNKKRKIDKPFKKWTDSEVIKILEYIIQERNLEKPFAHVYYAKLLKATKIDASWDLVKWKVRNLKRLFHKTVDWKKSAGTSHLEDADCSCGREKVLRMCPHFNMLSQIFGEKIDVDTIEFCDSLDLSSSERSIDSHTEQNNIDPAMPSPASILSPNLPSTTPPTSQNAPVFVKKIKKTNPALLHLRSFHSERMAFYTKRLEVDNRRLDLDERRLERELQLQEEKQKQDFEIKKLALEKEERIARFEIEMKYKAQLNMLSKLTE